jgi:hypothetical protein
MIKVYAAGINDLTVARYVAAMNVDLVGFSTNAANKSSIIEMINWIEGPQIIVEVEDTEFIEEAVVSVPCHFVYDKVNENFLQGSLNNENNRFPVIIKLENPQQLDVLRLNIEEEIYFSLDEVSDDFLMKVDGLNSGIVLFTGSEESIGIKSFDDLEEIFEKLETYNLI